MLCLCRLKKPNDSPVNAKLRVIQVSAVIAVGLVEGFSHVNWKMFFQLLWWWVLGFLAVVLSTTVLVAQGESLSTTCLLTVWLALMQI